MLELMRTAVVRPLRRNYHLHSVHSGMIRQWCTRFVAVIRIDAMTTRCEDSGLSRLKWAYLWSAESVDGAGCRSGQSARVGLGVGV